MMFKTINLKAIRLDGDTQSRTKIHDETIKEYVQAMQDGATFPAIKVFFDGVDYWLVDGFHRWHAHNSLGRASIDADVQSGSADAARLEAAKANQTHGLRRTNEDKRKSVEMVLRDENVSENWTDREIAKHCGVSHPFVAAIRSPQIAAKQKENKAATIVKQAQNFQFESKPQEVITPKVETLSTPTANVVIEPAPKPTPAPGPEREQEQEPEYSELDAARDQVSDLQRDLVVALMGNVPEDQKTQAASKIDELNAEIKSLSAQLDAVTKSRNDYMNENAAMKNQMAAQRRELEKLRKKA
jgi:hypothetical protein